MESLSIVELRRCLRDLFALAMLPASWHHHDPKQTAQSLADAVLRTLDVELVYVLVPDAGGLLAVLREEGGAAHNLHAVSELFAPFIQQGGVGPRVNVLGTEMNLALQTIDLPSAERGVIVVGAVRSDFPTQIDSALLRVAANQAAVALANTRYIAELNQAAVLRDQLVAELATASKRKDHFLAVLGHELRNPLAAIHAAHLQTLTKPQPGRAQEIITHQLTTLMRLVDDLLDASRVSTGKLALQRQRLDLREVLEKARAACDHAAAQKGHRLTMTTCEDPLWVDGDQVRLEQVIVNLVANAVRYTEAGGNISIAVSRTSDDHALVRVDDDGRGITAELLPRIFEPFVQADMALERAEGGLGLGLALVKGVVELHGGSVDVTSGGPGKGCTVLVRLPLVANIEHPATTEPAAPLLANPRTGLRVLLVDDNADMTEMIAMLLQQSGHDTAAASDGLAALELAGRFSPDVAFIDIGLPGIDGHEVGRRLRAQLQSSVVLIAMSGYGQDEDRARSRLAGFDDHLVKPVPPERLEQVLTKIALARGN
jgi:signal transduction histidine kinase/CheY-like chemotaxis protein